MKNRTLFVLASLLLLYLFSCNRNHEQLYTVTRPAIGTVITLTIFASSAVVANEVFARAFSEIDRLGALLGPAPGSDPRKIGESPVGTVVQLSSDGDTVLKSALDISQFTSGAFDVTFASAGNLYDFTQTPFVPPTPQEVRSALAGVSYKNLRYDTGAVVRLHEKSRVGLGGIAKGYIIEKVVEVLQDGGVTSGIVDAGGDLQVFGSKKSAPWVTALRHPRDQNSLLFSFPVSDGTACATSGDYERFAFDKKGKRYHHIIDPRTGYPAQGVASVTVMCKSSMEADAFATALFVLGVEKSRELLKKRTDLQVIMVDSDLHFFASRSLKGELQALKEGLVVTWID